MMKYIILMILSIMPMISFCSDDKEFYVKEMEMGELAFKCNDTIKCLLHCKNIINEFESDLKYQVKDVDICNYAFNAYSSLFLWDKDSSKTIEYFDGILYMLRRNRVWAKETTSKEEIKNFYTITINKYIECGKFDSAIKYRNDMIWFAENFYRSNLNSILLTACIMTRNMNKYDEANEYCERLYTCKEELDNIAKYYLISTMIHYNYTNKNYNRVLELSEQHKRLIKNSNEITVELTVDFICSSMTLIADSYESNTYSRKADSLYCEAYNWAKYFKHPFLPRAILNMAYYNYSFKERIDKAIDSYYLFMDYFREMSDLNRAFNYNITIGDFQNVVISILLNQILLASNPIDLNTLKDKYSQIFSYLINSDKDRESYKELIKILDMSWEVCYGK